MTAVRQAIASGVCRFWVESQNRPQTGSGRSNYSQPLISHEVIVNLIASTKTRSGLSVRAELDTAEYPKGLVISDAALSTISIERDALHGDWNYCIRAG